MKYWGDEMKLRETDFMECNCGSVIPEDSPRYPVTPQLIKRTKQKGEKKIKIETWETEIVKCADPRHPEHTQWNYVNQTILRSRG